MQLPDLTPYLEKCSRFPQKGEKAVCAVSGGPDSTALALLAAFAGCKVEIIHVDHCIREDSHKDKEYTANLAEKLGAEFHFFSAPVSAGGNLEARARKARHRFFGPDTMLAHTADDQAETLLLGLLRGSGTQGLSAMDSDARRPILELRKAETQKICEMAGLEPVQDPMNQDPAFTRNRIRNEVIPLLNDVSKRDVVPLLCRTASLLSEVNEHLDNCSKDLEPIGSAKELSEADSALVKWALRSWLMESTESDYPPDSASVERVMSVVRGEAIGTEITGGHKVRRSRQTLHVQPKDS